MQWLKKEMIKLLSFVFVVGVFLFFKFGVGLVTTSATIHAKNAVHKGWDGARAELRKAFESQVQEIKLPPEIKAKYLDCVTQKAIDFLNNTTCSYLYNKMTTTQEEHLRKQDACVMQSGYMEALEGFAEACGKEVIPD